MSIPEFKLRNEGQIDNRGQIRHRVIVRPHLQPKAGVFESDWVELQIDTPVVNVVAALNGEEASMGSWVIRHKPVR